MIWKSIIKNGSKIHTHKSVNQLLNCNSCKRRICNECFEHLVTEMRCLQSKNRIVLYLYDEYRRGLRCILELMRESIDLKKEVADLRETSLQTVGHDTWVNEQESLDINEDTVCEMMERNESQKINVYQRKEYDKNNLKVFNHQIPMQTKY